MIWLSKSFSQRLPRPWRRVDDVWSVDGEIYRNPEGANRRTLRFELGGKGYFLKLHWGVGWKEIIKNLITGRLPIVGAANEWRAIQRLQELGVETMRLEAYGEEGRNPAKLKSFVVTRELENTISLEDYCQNWRQSVPEFSTKQALITRVAQMTRTLHEQGINHRDLYICHFLLREPWSGRTEDLHLHLIDLHRVQQHRKLPRRWQVKDLGSLYFSIMEIGLTERDRWRFLKSYFGQPLREIFQQHRLLLQQTEKRAQALWAKGNRG